MTSKRATPDSAASISLTRGSMLPASLRTGTTTLTSAGKTRCSIAPKGSAPRRSRAARLCAFPKQETSASASRAALSAGLSVAGLLRQEFERGHLALQREVAVVEPNIAGDPVGIEIKGDGIDRRLLASLRLGRVEVGDVHRKAVDAV